MNDLNEETSLKIFVIFAHPEKKSFCSALKNICINSLKKYCDVIESNLYEMNLIEPLGKQDFKELTNKDFFKPQIEQLESNKMDFKNYIDPIKNEHEKVNWADILIFIFPLYWFSFPGIMKNWIDRVFSYGFAYGQTNFKGKRVMCVYTTGAAQKFISPHEKNIFKVMFDLIFGFCSLEIIKPFIVYNPAGMKHQDRKNILKEFENVMKNLVDRELYYSV